MIALRADPRPGVMLTGGPTPGDWSAMGAGFTALDEAGCPAIWLTDHLFWGRPMPEALTTCAVAATATSSAVIGTGVLQLPLRSTAATAKAAATVATLSGGRFVLGVGVGEHRREYQLAGSTFEHRGRDLDTGLDELRALWSPGGDDDWFVQRPSPPPIPIWLGGRSKPAVARTARAGDGWMPIFVTLEQFRAANARLDDALDALGRPRTEVVRGVTILAALAGSPSEADAALRWCGQLWNMPTAPLTPYLVAGSPADVAEAVAAHRAAGAEHVTLLLATDDPVPAHLRILDAVG